MGEAGSMWKCSRCSRARPCSEVACVVLRRGESSLAGGASAGARGRGRRDVFFMRAYDILRAITGVRP